MVLCDNRPGMLKQITAVISDANTNIRNIEAKTAETHATVDIIVDIADLKHLERIVGGGAQNTWRARCATRAKGLAPTRIQPGLMDFRPLYLQSVLLPLTVDRSRVYCRVNC